MVLGIPCPIRKFFFFIKLNYWCSNILWCSNTSRTVIGQLNWVKYYAGRTTEREKMIFVVERNL